MTIKGERQPLLIDQNKGKIYRLKKDGKIVEVGSKNNKGYLMFSFEGKIIGSHRFIYENFYNIKLKKREQIDHLNMIKDDNRIENLRIVNNSQNQQYKPKRKNCSSIYKGVYKDKENKKWSCQIQFNGKLKNLGRFNDEIDAVRCYNNFVKDNNLTYNYLPDFQKNIL